MQVALTPASVMERVFSWRWHLKVCSELLCNSNKLGAAWSTIAQHGGSGVVEQLPIKDMASDDECDLRRLLESMLDQFLNVGLVGILLERLNFHRDMLVVGSSQSSPLGYIDAWLQLLKVDSKNILRNKIVGKGSVGTVFQGEWFGAIKVALKYQVQDEVFYENLKRVSLLSHTNIVSVLGYIEDEDDKNKYRSCSEILELMDGNLITLMDQRMQEDGNRRSPFSIWEACDIMLQIAEGVRYMHQNRVLHRDLKSPSILFKRFKDDTLEYIHVKVAGFAHTKWIEKSKTNSMQTPNVGTTRWMAPELVGIPKMENSNRYQDMLKHPFKSDVYSFGMTCFEILTGDVPFANENSLRELKLKVLQGERPTLPQKTPQSLRNLIKLCWDPEPEVRPSFVDICEELRYIRCSLLLEPQDHTPLLPLPFREPLHLPPQVLEFKGEYASLKVVRKLGSGGSDMVTIFLSAWLQPKNEVAQKRFMGSHNECFKNEVTIMAELKHSNVVRLLHYATDRRSCSIVMELMDGDLHDLMHQRRLEGKVTRTTCPFSVTEAIQVMLQIAQGMQYVHEKHVVHRDLKSCNILIKNVSEGGKLEVKVADFGTSLKLKSGDTLLDKEESGVGTVRWMAPEVTTVPASKASSKYDPFKSDVFSYGMLCYEILVGRVPFYKAEDLYIVRKKVLDGERPTLPEWTPSNLKDLIEKCWMKEGSIRPTFTDIVGKLIKVRV